MSTSCSEEELFNAALLLPAAERDHYLRRACEHDPDLHARLDTLIDDFDRASQFVREPSLGEMSRLEVQIDNFRLLNEIGEGGVGVVYLAEQVKPVKRQVALKVIKPGMDTKVVIERFAIEQQALAIMHHPNIATVFEAGITSAGRPYFVMELVRGIPLSDYCDHCRLTVDERLRLFMQVCQAVQHAHLKGVIHRDIKPSNILVTLHDGVPLVKVIDFGIAKAIHGRLTDITLHTLVGHFVGTPAYVSPEQIDLGSDAVDIRSDVYSLGVVLYELLTGFTPHDIQNLSDVGLDGVCRHICENEPLSPSRRLRAIPAEQLAGKAATRHLEPSTLLASISGDLDWVVMKCLEKDRSRRYQTVNDLLLDLHRYLEHEPVSARPPSVAYAFARLARRHRLAFVSAAVVLVGLIAAAAVSIRFAVQARTAEQSANEVVRFLRQDLLSQASPFDEPDRDIKLRTVLDRAAGRIDGRFPGQPLVEASVLETVGTTYESLGEFVLAEKYLRQAQEIYSHQLGVKDPHTLKAMAALVAVLKYRDSFSEAEALARKTLDLQRKVLGVDHPDSLSMMNDLGWLYTEQGNYSAAEKIQREALELQTEALGERHLDTLSTAADLGVTLIKAGHAAEAEALLRPTLEIFQEIFPEEHPSVLTTMSSLASAYTKQWKFQAAEELNSEALAISVRVMGKEHLSTLIIMSNLAIAKEHLGRYAEAQQLKTEVLAKERRLLGNAHPITLSIASSLAFTLIEVGDLASARRLQIETLPLLSQTFGDEHPTTLWAMRNMALIYQHEGELEQAIEILNRGLAVATRSTGPHSREAAIFSGQLGSALLEAGRYAEAERILVSTLPDLLRLTPNDWRTFSSQSQLGEAMLALGKFSEAEPNVVKGYSALLSRSQNVPAFDKRNVDLAAKRVLKLYRAWDKPDRVEYWTLQIENSLDAKSAGIVRTWQ